MKIADIREEGDVAAMNAILNSELKAEAPALYRRLLIEWNARYADRIVELLAGKEDQLVAVGVDHLVGCDSVQKMLEAKGIKLRRIQ